MTDKEIIKALGLCFNINHNAGLNCGECPYKKDKCSLALYNDTIDLINRQQAEIDRLTNYNRCIDAQCRDLLDKEEKAKAKAIKEFAEKLKDVFVTIDGTFECWEIEEHIDNIVEEMAGADNGKKAE